ncbi:cell division protein SepF [Cellulomonas sp. NPDC057328]|uniref:cell division protein SepF n=1 Tax=Cellulomonas sp. NPDC057328 TaxID=3346101 RepID=UPI0036436E6D
MEPSLVVLEYVRALAWPIVAAVLGIVYRRDVRRVLARVTKVEALGTSLQFEAAIAELGLDTSIEPSPEPQPASPQFIEAATIQDAAAVLGAYEKGPVVVHLAAASDSEAKRLIDFMAGMVGGTTGAIDRIGRKSFTLTPPGSRSAPR